MSHFTRLCPDCGLPVMPTMRGMIFGHYWPSRDRPCPGTGKPFEDSIRTREPARGH